MTQERDFYEMTLRELLAHENTRVAQKANELAFELNHDMYVGRQRLPTSIPPRTMRDIVAPLTAHPS